MTRNSLWSSLQGTAKKGWEELIFVSFLWEQEKLFALLEMMSNKNKKNLDSMGLYRILLYIYQDRH